MTKNLNEICALGDGAHILLNKVRHMLRFAPDMPAPTCAQAFRDRHGRWWVLRVEACASEAEANILVGKTDD